MTNPTEQAREMYPNSVFDQLEYLLGLTHYSYNEGCDAWVACMKLFPQLKAAHAQALQSARDEERERASEALCLSENAIRNVKHRVWTTGMRRALLAIEAIRAQAPEPKENV